MNRLLLMILLPILLLQQAFAQQKVLDIPAMHQLISASESEYDLQQQARTWQAAVSANEQANLTVLAQIKKIYRELQQRYNTLGTAINVAQIGIDASPMVSRIVSNQAQIISLVRGNPALIAIGYESELTFAAKAESLLRYVTGLTLAYGDVNQMKASDRKILFDYVLSELSTVQELSGHMLSLMQYSSMAALLKAANPFQNFIDADRQLADQILQNAKYLK
ncbi:hypothetical protein HH214_08705 [Mucilaginibacter robiniae]|uniref:TerB family tellurite resistance protein n=1 Tax=Mucilaginibacter robiniae TaxID=2728022 RepID=A0A7L5E0Y2_9SPHI|nr:hypothetical protein [Mucilaginibacter robiniae]QJD95949.1 hypothetical protein HH214_08705 [Mucilaginibacter robiniae]